MNKGGMNKKDLSERDTSVQSSNAPPQFESSNVDRWCIGNKREISVTDTASGLR
jgi:hypothetical protein